MHQRRKLFQHLEIAAWPHSVYAIRHRPSPPRTINVPVPVPVYIPVPNPSQPQQAPPLRTETHWGLEAH